MEPLISAAPDIAVSIAATQSDAGVPILFTARQTGLHVLRPDSELWTPAFGSRDAPIAVSAVAVAPGDIVLAGVNGGLMRSNDAGVTWSVVPFASPPPLVTCIAFSPRVEEDGIMLAGTLEDGVFHSTDWGNTWKPTNTGLLDMGVLSIATAPGTDDKVIAVLGADTGVFLSENGGRSWRNTGFPRVDASVTTVAMSSGFAEDGLVLAGTDGAGLYGHRVGRSDWTRVTTNTATHVVSVCLLPACNTDHTALLVDADGVSVSDDAGATWESIPVELGDGASIIAACVFNSSEYKYQLAISLDNGAVCVKEIERQL